MPASAAGPSLRELLLGSEGVLGIITDVTLRVRPRPARRRWAAWSLPDFAAGCEALRELEQRTAAPDVARLSDEDETRLSLHLASQPAAARALRGYLAGRGRRPGCLAIAGFDGEPAHIARRHLRGALGALGTPPLVGCHVSHPHPTGASLYFTFLARGRPGEELEQWRAAKSAATDAISAAGATVTHHHAVGRDHARRGSRARSASAGSARSER